MGKRKTGTAAVLPSGRPAAPGARAGSDSQTGYQNVASKSPQNWPSASHYSQFTAYRGGPGADFGPSVAV
jgi:hypothetical protein